MKSPNFSEFMNEKKKGAWTGVVLHAEYVSKLIEIAKNFKQDFMQDWKLACNHITINMGNLPEKYEYSLGDEVKIKLTDIGWNETSFAIKVDGIKTFNKFPHITLAFHPTKGKGGYNSNLITKWKRIPNFEYKGIIKQGYNVYTNPKETL